MTDVALVTEDSRVVPIFMESIHFSEVKEEECYEISLKQSSRFGLRKKELCFLFS